MATFMQDRLKKLGLGGGNVKDAATPSSQAIPSWQQELNQYKRQQEEMSNPRPRIEEAIKYKKSGNGSEHVRMQPMTGAAATSSTAKLEQTTQDQEADVVFLRKGRKKAHLIDTERDGESMSEDEPVSSSVELAGTFCLFSQVIKFPYKYLQDPENKVSASFFSKGKAFERAWKLYSISAPEDMGGKSLFLVPYDQVEDLINQINAEIELQIKVPPYPFTMSFYKDRMPTPKLLGIVNSKDDFDKFKYSVPEMSSNDAESLTTTIPVQEDKHSWREKIETALAVESKKGSTNRRKKLKHQVKIASEHCDQLKRIQRYLGLRPSLPTTSIIRPHTLEGDEQREALTHLGVLPDALNVDKVVDYPFEDQTVILAVDVESWEECHSVITEIGISTLDTTELINIPPGLEGENWTKQIRSRHFRLLGCEHLRNVKYCPGDPENFRFGNSEFVSIDDAPKIVDSCFEWPFSANPELKESPKNSDEAAVIVNGRTALDVAYRRNLLLIGHDLGGDINYLSQLGSEIFDINSNPSRTHIGTTPSRRQRVLRSIRERLDTATLHKVLTQDTQIRSLTKVCYDLDITAWHTHNAGNDARYTLEAFVKLAFKAREQNDADNTLAGEKGRPNAQTILQGLENEIKVQAKLQAAREAINMELEGRGNEILPG